MVAVQKNIMSWGVNRGCRVWLWRMAGAGAVLVLLPVQAGRMHSTARLCAASSRTTGAPAAASLVFKPKKRDKPGTIHGVQAEGLASRL